jgi:hypothetical protein
MNRRRCAVGLWSVMLLSMIVGPSPATAHFVWVEADAIAPAETGQPLKDLFRRIQRVLYERNAVGVWIRSTESRYVCRTPSRVRLK